MEVKTNPMRHLDKLGIEYEVIHYADEPLSGIEVATKMGQDPNQSFKTLITEGSNKTYYCFVVPVSGELDLKKAAASVGEKSVAMLRSDKLLSIVGYVHGGCSPLCTKRPLKTRIDSTARNFPFIYFSAGKIGYQLKVPVADLPKALDFEFADIRRPIV